MLDIDYKKTINAQQALETIAEEFGFEFVRYKKIFVYKYDIDKNINDKLISDLELISKESKKTNYTN